MIINPISKGGKGLLPEIIVTAPSGSTLDLIQNSVVLQTYTLSSTETQHTFTVKNTGTYTVRGTSGSDTASVEVVVDVVGRYTATITFKVYTQFLYYYGDEYEDITGGIQWTYYYAPASGQKYDDYLYSSGSGSTTSNWRTTNRIDLTNFIGGGRYRTPENSTLQRPLHICDNTAGYPVVGSYRPRTESKQRKGKFVSDYFYQSNTDTVIKISGSYYPILYQNYDATSGNETIYAFWLFETDKWGELCQLMGVSASSVSDAISHASDILNNETYVDYMLSNCTGEFMNFAVQDSSFMSVLLSSPYKDKIYANDIWSKFLAMATA